MSSLLSLNKTYTTTPAPNAGVPDTGGTELTNGTVGPFDAANAAWVGWPLASTDPVIPIDLGVPAILSYVRFHFYVETGVSLAYAPEQLVVSGSVAGVSYDTLGTFVKTTDWSNTTGAVYWSNNLTVAGQYRYVKFAFTHQTNWLLLSELEVYGNTVGGLGFFRFFK